MTTLRSTAVSGERRRFLIDSLAGLASIAVLGVAGLLINVLIARYYGAAVLGVFNQVFALYILGAQFAALGIQFSVLRYAAEHHAVAHVLTAMVRSGLVLVAATALVVTLAIWALRPVIGAGFSPDVAQGLGYALPGLWAFAVNKYLLNTLNGMRRMRTYSAFLSARYAALLIGIAAATALHVDGNMLAAVFTFAEIVVLVCLIATMRSLVVGRLSRDAMREWSRAHLHFGLRSVTGGAVSELNTRVDVLVLGLFTTDRIVGIFSYAAILSEGLLQIPLVVKRQADPALTPLVLDREHERLLDAYRTWRRWTYAVMALAAALGVALFPWFTAWATHDAELQSGWLIFTILIVAGTVQAGFVPVSGILGQGGFPTQQTLFLIWVFVSNIVLNVALVPFFGAVGAALSTATVYVASIFYLKYLVKRYMAIGI